MCTGPDVVVPILLTLSESEVIEGATVTITCEVLTPTTPVTLTNNGYVVFRAMTSTMNNKHIWTYNSAEIRDGGVYVCEAGSQTSTESDSPPQTLLVGCELQVQNAQY